MSQGSTNTTRFKNFQIRWKEKLGFEDEPYLIRWTFIVFGFSIRIHHWIKSDDRRFYHDHSADLLSIVLKGEYDNVVPLVPDQDPNFNVNIHYPEREYWKNERRCHVEGIFNSFKNFLNMRKSIWFSKAEQQQSGDQTAAKNSAAFHRFCPLSAFSVTCDVGSLSRGK